jgi:hypothetical protein
MDSLTFVTPANVRSLIVPVNELDQTDFEKILETLKRVKDVRAVDLTHNPGKFNPQAYPQGHIYLNFVTRDEDEESLFLHDFEPYRKTTIVIGIAKWNDELNTDIIRNLKSELKKKYPAPMSQFVMIFDCPIDFSCELSEVYAVNENTSNMETKICDLTSRFLSNFSTYASAYEHTTLRSPGNLNGTVSKPKRKITSSFELNPEKVKQMSSKGRKQKLVANFYLMAGNLKSSLSEFCEAIFNLKAANDFLWLASALDGLAVCLFLLSSIGAPYQLPPFIHSLLDSAKDIDHMLSSPMVSPRPSLQLNTFSSLNNLSNHTPEPTSLSVVPLDVVESTIFACGKLSVAYYEQARHFGIDYVPQIVVSESLLRYASLLVLINTNGKFDLNLIEEILYSSTIYNGNHVSKSFDLEYFNNLCFHVLNAEFKHLAPSQQLKFFYTLTFLYSRTNMNMKKCLMIKNFFDLVISSQHIISINRFEYQSLNNLLKEYCENYGIAIDSKTYIKHPNHIQKKILYQILHFCEKINHYEGYIYYSSIILSHFRSLLTESECISIHDKIKGYKVFINKSPEYWDSNFFLDFQFQTTVNQIVEAEECNVNILIRNSFAFEIEIKDLELSTENNFPLEVFATDKRQVDGLNSLPTIYMRPFMEMVIPIIIIPKKNGKLVIDGIIASVDICKRQKFVTNNRKAIPFLPKIKRKPINIVDTYETIKTWEISVVYKQPLLKIVDIKLTDKWLMLLDGEKKQFKVVLKNMTDTEINHLISKFKDSTTDKLTAELSNKLLQPNEIYEIEYQLLMKKPFKILNKHALVQIKGNESFHLEVEITGKLGVNEAHLVLEYSHQKDTLSEFKRSLTIPVNLTVYPSVELAGCDIISLTTNTRISEQNDNLCWKYLKSMKGQNFKLSNFCLLALDFVNMWSEEMEICIEYDTKATDPKDPKESYNSAGEVEEGTFVTRALLHSRKNIRVFIPLLRMDFEEEFLDRRIPSLRNKQFIVDKKTPVAEQTFINHAFWYKEEILKHLKATWKISSTATNSIHSGKCGDIELRGFKFSSKMIEVLEVEKIGIQLKLLNENNEEVDLNAIESNKFYTIHVRLTNRNKYSIFGIIRHIPVCKDPPYTYEKKILINGVLQFSIEQSLDPGHHRNYDLGVVFIEKGEYEWGVLFDEINDWEEGHINIKKQHLQREQLKFTVK